MNGLNYYNPPVMNGYSFGYNPLLGRDPRCPRGFEYNRQCNCCFQTSGGGSDIIIGPRILGASAVDSVEQYNQELFDALPFTDKVIQWSKDNPVLAIGAAAAIGYILYKIL